MGNARSQSPLCGACAAGNLALCDRSTSEDSTSTEYQVCPKTVFPAKGLVVGQTMTTMLTGIGLGTYHLKDHKMRYDCTKYGSLTVYIYPHITNVKIDEQNVFKCLLITMLFYAAGYLVRTFIVALTLLLPDRKNIIRSQCMGNSLYRRQHYITYHGYKYGFIRHSGDYYLFPPPEISGGQGSERVNKLTHFHTQPDPQTTAGRSCGTQCPKRNSPCTPESSPIPLPITSSSSDSPLCTSITPSLFHSRLKTYLFHKSYPPSFHFFLPDCLHGLLPAPFLLSYLVFDFDFFTLFFVSGPCARLSWPSRQLLSACKSTVSYRIVS